MQWKGNELTTIGDLMYRGIGTCETREEAQEFMTIYRRMNKWADDNIGYIAGYYSPSERQRIQDWFGVVHPIFGKDEVSPERAFQMGKDWARTAP